MRGWVDGRYVYEGILVYLYFCNAWYIISSAHTCIYTYIDRHILAHVQGVVCDLYMFCVSVLCETEGERESWREFLRNSLQIPWGAGWGGRVWGLHPRTPGLMAHRSSGNSGQANNAKRKKLTQLLESREVPKSPVATTAKSSTMW